MEALIGDMQAGKAGEYLVCADLILQGFIAFPSEQGLPYDVVADVGTSLVRIQVKTTRQPLSIPQRVNQVPGYLFHVRRKGKEGRKRYEGGEVDIFALVGLDLRTIGYVPAARVRTTMIFRVPTFQGLYKGEGIDARKEVIAKMRGEGMTYKQIAAELNVDAAYAHRVATGQEDSERRGAYLHDFTFRAALEAISS
jgi:hypothetical protein